MRSSNTVQLRLGFAHSKPVPCWVSAVLLPPIYVTAAWVRTDLSTWQGSSVKRSAVELVVFHIHVLGSSSPLCPESQLLCRSHLSYLFGKSQCLTYTTNTTHLCGSQCVVRHMIFSCSHPPTSASLSFLAGIAHKFSMQHVGNRQKRFPSLSLYVVCMRT